MVFIIKTKSGRNIVTGRKKAEKFVTRKSIGTKQPAVFLTRREAQQIIIREAGKIPKIKKQKLTNKQLLAKFIIKKL